jgi:hypothetical protein
MDAKFDQVYWIVQRCCGKRLHVCTTSRRTTTQLLPFLEEASLLNQSAGQKQLFRDTGFWPGNHIMSATTAPIAPTTPTTSVVIIPGECGTVFPVCDGFSIVLSGHTFRGTSKSRTLFHVGHRPQVSDAGILSGSAQSPHSSSSIVSGLETLSTSTRKPTCQDYASNGYPKISTPWKAKTFKTTHYTKMTVYNCVYPGHSWPMEKSHSQEINNTICVGTG